MAFSDLELQYIKNTIGAMCQRRSPPQFKNELRTIYEVESHSVLVYETRPRWDKPQAYPHGWTKSGIAKFRYIQSRKIWKLYWMRQDLKWHAYDPAETGNLETLVQVVDKDEYGAFFG